MEKIAIEQRESICAISTSPGEGGIAIVRASGSGAKQLFESAFVPARKQEIKSHIMRYGYVLDENGQMLDEVMAVFFASPKSYTREDMLEIHCHGGNISAARVLKRLIELGARVAEPGEFTKRAFMNGRIDLSRAEAVMALIGATSEAAARASVQQLAGGISAFVRGISSRIKDVLSLIEASTDFPDEVEEDVAAKKVLDELRLIQHSLLERIDEKGARIVREGASIVILGRPNVGKSSLMNALLHFERAIVTDIPGTTRDVLTERITLGGIVAQLSDTAGQHSTDDIVEQIGVNRAKEAAVNADLRILLLDGSCELTDEDRQLLETCEEPRIICINKCDLESKILLDGSCANADGQLLETCAEPRNICINKCELDGAISISAREGTGLDELTQRIQQSIAPQQQMQDMMTSERHIHLTKQCHAALERAARAIEEQLPLDVCAIDMLDALENLSEITGENASEAVIARVFENFCVGK